MKIIFYKWINDRFLDSKTKWASMTRKGKFKAVVNGAIIIGSGWIFGNLVDTEHGKIVGTCTYLAACGMGTVAGVAACEAFNEAIDQVWVEKQEKPEKQEMEEKPDV